MYLLHTPSGSKLGFYQRAGERTYNGLGRLGYRPNQAVRRNIYGRRQPVLHGLRGYRGMGQDETDLFEPTPTPYSTTLFPQAPDTIDTSSNYGIPTTLTPPDTSVYPTGVQPVGTAAWASMASQVTPVSNVTDYVSPAAAIAAGAPAATVNAAWATPQGVNSFSSPSAATAALTASMGAAQAAATVAKLWSGGGAPSPVTSSGLPSTIAGLPTAAVLGIGGLILVLGLMGGRH
jgi:hypothetical protein